MTYIILTINILEYSPKTFNFEDFKFIFSYNQQIYGDEISFISKNKIIQKIKLEQKDINFSIKVIKKDSLIGISNFIIPYKNILSKKVQIYEKESIINMNDSTKRILSIKNFILKINIHCNIKYIDKENTNENNNQKIFVNTNKKLNFKDKSNTIYSKKSLISKNNDNITDNNQLKIVKIKQNKNNNNLIYNKPRNYIIKKISKDNKENINNSDNYNDNSFDTEEELIKKIEIIDSEFLKFIPELIKENPIENFSKIEDINEMILITKNNILKFLNYQKDCYKRLRNYIDIYEKYNKLLKKYCQKYANKVKKLKNLEKKQKINEISKILNKNILFSKLYKILEIKNNEIDLFKVLSDNYNYNSKDNIEDNLNINEINKNLNIEKETNRDYNLLIDLLKNCVINFEKNEKIMKFIPKEIFEKYDFNNDNNISDIEKNNLDISLADNDDNIFDNKNDEQSNINELNYVESNVNDEIDYELDNYLKDFYKDNKNIPIIKFKKIHDNNYKYGKIQIIIIEEGDLIKIKDDNGIFTLNKFLELNSIKQN